VIALLGLRLTPCQWSILRLLLAHPLLSDEELAAFLQLATTVGCAVRYMNCVDWAVWSRSRPRLGNAGISVRGGCV